ncbi:MAG: DUF444 family protein [Bdellovibrionota bacterium]
MALKIDQNYRRFKEIIRGKIKQDLKKYMSSGEMIGKQGKDYVSIPLPRINLPHFEFDHEKKGGVGQGEGKEGDSVGQPGEGKAGSGAGRHVLEVDVSMEELAQIMGEELELPRIEPKGQKQKLDSPKYRYTGVRPTGPESLKHFRRTYRQALKRQIVSGSYNANDPVIIPIRDDKRYRSWKEIPQPVSNAVIVYIMDVSGSMGQEQKDIVRTESFWIDTWLRSQYKGIESRYIIHDAAAKEVDQETFYHTKESGGTIISSAYKLCHHILTNHFDPSEWNMYVFHFSDGDNWSAEDTNICVKILKNELLPLVNMFGYGQVESQYGSGQFIKDLQKNFKSEKEFDHMITSKIDSKDDILQSIKTFLGKGK